MAGKPQTGGVGSTILHGANRAAEILIGPHTMYFRASVGLYLLLILGANLRAVDSPTLAGFIMLATALFVLSIAGAAAYADTDHGTRE